MFALTYLRNNTAFCLSLVFCVAVVLFVPQINGVMLQTIEMPRITPHERPDGAVAKPADDEPTQKFDFKSTAEAVSFLTFLSVLFAGSFAAINWVLPTSWFNCPPHFFPLPVAPPPGKKRTILAGFAIPALLAVVPCRVSVICGALRHIEVEV